MKPTNTLKQPPLVPNPLPTPEHRILQALASLLLQVANVKQSKEKSDAERH